MLEAIGRKLGIDSVYFIKNGFILFFGDFVNIILTFFLSIVFANFLSTETFGSYTFVTAILSILSVFSLPRMKTAISKAVANGREEVFLHAINAVFKWSFIGSLFLVGTGLYYFFIGGENELWKGFFICALLFPILSASGLYSGYFEGRENFKKASGIYILLSIAMNLGLMYAAWINTTMISLLLIFLFSQIFVNGIATLSITKKIHDKKSDTKDDIKFGVRLSFISLIQQFANYGDKFIIGLFLDFHSLGIYTFAFLIPEQIKLFLKNIFTLALPKYSKKNESEITGRVWRHWLYILVPTLLVIAAYIAAAPKIFEIFFPKYIGSIVFSQAIALSLVFLPSKIFITAFEAHGKTSSLLIINTVLPIQKIILLLALIPILHTWGAVIALAISRITEMIICPLLFHQNFEEKNKA